MLESEIEARKYKQKYEATQAKLRGAIIIIYALITVTLAFIFAAALLAAAVAKAGGGG